MSKKYERIKSVAVYCGSRTPMDRVYEEAAVGRTPEELFGRPAGSLPPVISDDAKKDDLKVLWREMKRDKAKYGNPGGAPFANAFYEVARCYPLASWRKAGGVVGS